MWLYILLFTLCLVLAPLLRALCTLLYAKYKLKFYEAQGIPTFFHPQGIFSILLRNIPENAKRSNNEYSKKIAEVYRDKPAVAFNRIGSTGSYLFINKEDCIREFLLKEEHFDKVAPDRISERTFGFFFQNGHKIVQSRALFSKAFNFEKLSRFTLDVSRMTCQIIQKYCGEQKVDQSSFTRLNLHEMLDDVLERTLNIFTFGQETIPCLPSGTSLYRSIYSLYKLIVGLKGNLLYLLMPELCLKYGLIQDIRKILKISEDIKSHVKNLFLEREKKGIIGNCALDIIIEHNQKCKADGNMQEYIDDQELFGSINTFQFAGTDTSQSLVTSVLCEMAEFPQLQQIFAKINEQIFDEQGNIDKDKLTHNPGLDMWMKESLRKHDPVTRMIPRVAKTDFALNGINIRKGDAVGIGMIGFHYDARYFHKPEEFEAERFTKDAEKSLPRHQFIPFGVGKRVCLGRSLGELISKLILCQFCRVVEFRKPDSIEYYTYNTALNTELYPFVEVKKKASTQQSY